VAAVSKLKKSQDHIGQIEREGLYFWARGCIWSRVRTEGAFWICDLVKEGTSFTDRAQRVAMLPAIENIEAIHTHIFDKPVFVEEAAQGNTFTENVFHLSDAMGPEIHPLTPNLVQVGNRVAANAAVQFKAWQYEPLSRVLSLPFPRLLIADDVGLGKTTEAGLVLSHLAQMGQADRMLIIAPAHLCQKWKNELQNRFGLYFEIFDRNTRHRLSKRGVRNPWAAHERVIVSQDFAKRYENLKPLRRTEWDMVVIDECHHFITGSQGMTSRLRELAEGICVQSPGLMLLSATPYRGGSAEYDSLLALVDPLSCERDAEGKLSAAADELRHRIVVRRLKRDLPESTDFPERVLKNINVGKTLGTEETLLVKQVKEFLEDFKASPQTASHLTAEILQKRVSSSWNAFLETFSSIQERDINLQTEKLETFKKAISKFSHLNQRAKQSKYAALHAFVKEHIAASSKKLVIFTEYVDTLDFIYEALALDFKNMSIAAITGSEVKARFKGKDLTEKYGIQRHDIEAEFSNAESPLQILLCTDACSEGVDFQKACHMLMHYELPWSLIRMEQRNGRIDRFGQTHPPQIFNLVYETDATPDQRILARISDRLEEARREFGSVSDLIEDVDSGQTDLAANLLRGNEFKFEKPPEKPNELLFKESKQKQKDLFKLSDEHFQKSWQFHQICLGHVLEHERGGGTLRKTKTEGVFLLTLGEADLWDLRGLERTYGYPSAANPWRVSFNPKSTFARSLVSDGRGIGEEPSDLHFLSAFHPVMDVAFRKYKSLLFKNGAPPLLVVPGMLSKFALVYEFSLHSAGDRGVVLFRSLSSVTEDGHPLPDFNAAMDASIPVRKGMCQANQLPTDKSWNKAIEAALSLAKNDAANLLLHLNKHTKQLVSETRTLEQLADEEKSKRKFKGQFLKAREDWIKELRTPSVSKETNEPLLRIQPLCLFIQGKKES
jgi:ERCC4-related helicase